MNEGVAFGLCVAGVFLLIFTGDLLRCLFPVSRSGAKSNGKLGNEQFVNASTWGIFLIMTAAGHVHRPDDPSILITVGAAMQLLAMILLWITSGERDEYARVASGPEDNRGRVTAPRASLEFATIFALAVALRVFVTVTWEGYLPNDPTGDGCIQLMEILTLCCIAYGLTARELWNEWRSALTGITMSVLLCVLAGCICFGDLDIPEEEAVLKVSEHTSSTLSDKVYASSIYLEMVSWFHMVRFMRDQNRKISTDFFLPSALQAFCRAFYWHAAFGETIVRNPILLQGIFPWVLISCHVAMGMTTAYLGFIHFGPISRTHSVDV
jgi:hypothetical protein